VLEDHLVAARQARQRAADLGDELAVAELRGASPVEVVEVEEAVSDET